MTTARRLRARSIGARAMRTRSIGARSRLARVAIEQRFGAANPIEVNAARVAQIALPMAFRARFIVGIGRAVLRAQSLRGQIAISKARANLWQRGAPTAVCNRIARETRTSGAAVQTRVRATITFARRQMALIPYDGAQTKPVERVEFARRKRGFHFMRATARAPQFDNSERPNSTGTPRLRAR